MKRKVLSRRQFLEPMGILGGLGAAYYGMANFGLLPLLQAYTGPPRIDQHSGEGQHIVILGAGIGGLCAAYLLRNSNFKITIIEPNPDVGGRC
jgi:monoamine oxidase